MHTCHVVDIQSFERQKQGCAVELFLKSRVKKSRWKYMGVSYTLSNLLDVIEKGAFHSNQNVSHIS